MTTPFKQLYSRTSTGAIQTWDIEVEDNKYRTIHGQLDGKLQTTNWTECIVTNEGRANQRTPELQALFEANALHTKKIESGYCLNIDDIDIQKFIEPMLAKKWEDRKSKVTFPLYCQPKLDGMRAIITRHGAKSRNGKDWVTIPHILKSLEPLFRDHPNLVLDGELYCNKFSNDFNAICSLVKRTKPSANDLELSAKSVQFWWYDICDSTKKFSERSNNIIGLASQYGILGNDKSSIIVVRTVRVKDQEHLDECYGRWLNDGYEGQMVRVDAPYEFKRSSYLLKRKEFFDEEFQILDIIEGDGNRSGTAGAMSFKTKGGELFNSNIKGDRAHVAEIWKNRTSYIGKLATVVYFNLTPDKLIPRFPFVHSIRDYEDS